MSNLYFIRGLMGSDPTVCCDDKTEVYIFGDIAGFGYLQHCLAEAKTAKRNIHMRKLNFRSFTMRCVILPANRLLKRKRLKFIERLIFVNRKPRMELVIYGTTSGYDYLVRLIQSLIDGTVEDIERHMHLDDLYNSILVKRSVNLQLTDPLKIWTKQKLPPYVWTEIFEKPASTQLPTDPLYKYDLEHPKRYAEINLKEDEYLLSLK